MNTKVTTTDFGENTDDKLVWSKLNSGRKIRDTPRAE